MNIYLCYIINSAGVRMLQMNFDTMCLKCEWNNQLIRKTLTENGYRLDTGFGIDMEEAINMAKARDDFGRGHHS